MVRRRGRSDRGRGGGPRGGIACCLLAGACALFGGRLARAQETQERRPVPPLPAGPGERPTESGVPRPGGPGPNRVPESRPGADSLPASDAPGGRGGLLRPWVQRARALGELFGAPVPDSVRLLLGPARDTLAAYPEVSCSGQPVRAIRVRAFGPYTGQLREGFAWFGQLVQAMHANTRDDVVKGFLLLREGRPCTELARRESERILRAQPFLVDARIVAHDDGKGGVLLDVATRDELSALVEVSATAAAPMLRGARIGETNLGGRGMLALVEWREGRSYNDRLGLRLQHWLLGGRPDVLVLQGARDFMGHNVSADVFRPYLTDLQRFAYRVAVLDAREYAGLLRPGGEGNALPLTRRAADATIVRRLGAPGSLWLVGSMLNWEQHDTDIGEPVLLRREGVRPDTAGRFPQRFRDHAVARFNLLGGYRRVRFQRVEGFDALSGAQDVRLGFQGGVQVGRSIRALGMRDDDVFAGGGAYWADGGTRSFLAVQAHLEGRHDRARSRWDEVVASGRAAWYLRPSGEWLSKASVEWSAGWNASVPFQLSFAAPDGGVRGYGRSTAVGGQRLVGRLEQRWVPPRALTAGDVGIAAFTDVGHLWAGGVPYADGDRLAASVGLSLLATAPRRSRRTWRVDIAWPLTPHAGARGPSVRFVAADFTRAFWRDPRDLRRVRDQSVPESLFNWP